MTPEACVRLIDEMLAADAQAASGDQTAAVKKDPPMRMTPNAVENIADALEETAEEYRERLGRFSRRMIVCSGTGCLVGGAEAVYQALVDAARRAEPDLARRLDEDTARRDHRRLVVVCIMPCTAKKEEARLEKYRRNGQRMLIS